MTPPFSEEENQLIWKLLDKPFVFTLILLVSFFIVSFPLLNLSTGISLIVASIGSIVISLYLILYALACCGPYRLRLAILCIALSASVHILEAQISPSLFYKSIISTSQPENDISYEIVGGLLSNSYFIKQPQLLKVDKKAIKIAKPWFIKASTSEGLFERTFVCPNKSITYECGSVLSGFWD